MTDILLIYSALLLLAVLISSLANRSILSTSVLFLAGGILLSPAGLGVLSVPENSPLIRRLAEYALFASLFTDGMLVGLKDLRSAWKLPGRALLLGMPLTMLVMAAAAHWLLGLPWLEAFLLGAVLSPTDPVFASAIIGSKNIPGRLRHLLHVESGINDGLALPVVLILLTVLSGGESHYLEIAQELVLGVVVGIAIPFVAIKLERSPFFAASPTYRPLNAVAIGLLVYAVTKHFHMNEFLAAFSGGVTIATMSVEVREAFHRFGEIVSELLKFGALLLFGAMISPETLQDISLHGWLFVLIALFLVRTIAIVLSLLGSELSWKEVFAAAWFGPRGFASVVYGLLILEAGLDHAGLLFHLVAMVVVVSIIAHSSTDVLIAGMFRGEPQRTASPAEPIAPLDLDAPPEPPATESRPSHGNSD